MVSILYALRTWTANQGLGGLAMFRHAHPPSALRAPEDLPANDGFRRCRHGSKDDVKLDDSSRKKCEGADARKSDLGSDDKEVQTLQKYQVNSSVDTAGTHDRSPLSAAVIFAGSRCSSFWSAFNACRPRSTSHTPTPYVCE